MIFAMPVKTGRRVPVCRWYRCALCFLALSVSAAAAWPSDQTLSLPKALDRTLAQNPQLQVFDLRLQGLAGRRTAANQSPALEAGLEVENFLGNGEQAGMDGAEYTLSLSSVLELGGKRQARVGVIDARSH